MPENLTEQEKAVRAAQHVETIDRNFGAPFSRHGFAVASQQAASIGYANGGGATVTFFYETRANIYAFDGLALLTFPEDPEYRIPLPTIFNFFRDTRDLNIAQYDGVRDDRIRTEVDRYGVLFDLCADELFATPGIMEEIRAYQLSTGVYDPRHKPDTTLWAEFSWEPYNLVGESLDRGSVQKFQTENGITFPESYLGLLSEHMGQIPAFASVDVGSFKAAAGYLLGFVPGSVDEPREYPNTVPFFYHTSVAFHGFPERIIPFMSGGGGDVAFDYRHTDVDPPVIFLDGESEGEEAIFPVASSFHRFINGKLISTGE